VLATQDIRSLKRRLKGRVVVVKQALFERMAHAASTAPLSGVFPFARKTTSNCLLVLNTTTGVQDFSQMFPMLQAVTSSSLEEPMHFCGSHDVTQPGSGS
jgi:hypothetical protein